MIASQLEIIAQAETYLNSISPAQYNEVISSHFVSSAGAHMRHIIEHYLSLKSGAETGVVNYDHRQRGGDIETNPQAALTALADIRQWLVKLNVSDEQVLNQSLVVKSEVSVSQTLSVKLPSSLARELVFVGSHAVHHYAMIGQIVQHQSANHLIELPKGFGIAPATASFLRTTANAH